MAYRNNYEDLLKDIQASGQSWSTYDLDLARENPDAGRSIFTQKQAYANAQTDAERQAANDAAEMIRKQYGGYSAGVSGNGFTLVGTGNQKAPSYTQYASKYKDQIDELMAQLGGYANGKYESQYQGQIDDLMSQLVNRGQYDSQYQGQIDDLMGQLANRDKYDSKYQGQIDDVMGQLMNRDPFSYSPTDDPSYAAYAEHYRNAGNQAREDAMAQAAAMTGGQVSSYAMAAAQQAQNAYNAKMSDIIPQLREAAYGMYMDEGNAMRDNLSSLLALDQAAYGKYMDEGSTMRDNLSALLALDQSAYGKYMDEGSTMRDNMSSLLALDQAAYGKYLDEGSALRDYLSDLMALDQSAYNQHQNDYANQMAEWEANYQVSRDAYEDAQPAKASKSGGSGPVYVEDVPDDAEDPGEMMHFNEYKDFYYSIKESISNGNYSEAEDLFNKNADRLTDYQYNNLMKLLG